MVSTEEESSLFLLLFLHADGFFTGTKSDSSLVGGVPCVLWDADLVEGSTARSWLHESLD